MLVNAPYVLGTVMGRMSLGIISFGIMSHSALCRIRPYVAFGLMSFGYVLFGIMSLGLMSFGVMSFGLLSVYLLTIYGTQRGSSYPLSTVILICGSNSMAVARSEGVQSQSVSPSLCSTRKS